MIETERLRLRLWTERDRAGFGTVASAPEPGGIVKMPVEIDTSFAARLDDQARHGHCYWAAELKATGDLVGSCGIRIADNHADAPIHALPEIGWRIAEAHWRRGYALEAARASLAWGWANLDTPMIWAGTRIANEPSWRLMERLGMTRRRELDFRNRSYPADHPSSATIVYAIERPA